MLPNKSEIIEGLNIPFNRQGIKKAIVFGIYTNDVAYSHVSGWPQERIDMILPQAIPGAYMPDNPNQPSETTYHLNGNVIGDYKECDPGAAWNTFANGEVFIKYDQTNRINYTDCSGVLKRAYLSTHTIQYRSVNATQLQMEEVLPDE